MPDYDELRKKLPDRIYLVAERRSHLVASLYRIPERIWVELDAEGDPVTPVPLEVVKVRYQTAVRLTAPSRPDAWQINYKPSLHSDSYYVGDVMKLDKATFFLEPGSDELMNLVNYGCDRIIVTPMGVVIPYDVGDKILAPSRLGMMSAAPKRTV